MNVSTLPRVSSGNFFLIKKNLGKHVLFSVNCVFFQAKSLPFVQRSKIEKEQGEKEEKTLIQFTT
jgi:hypothetical protein